MNRRWLYDVGFLFVLIPVVLLIAGPMFAQNATPPTGGGGFGGTIANLIGSIDPTTLCLAIGALIAAGVKWAKKLPIVARFPKATAFVLSGIVAFFQHLAFDPHGKFGPVLTCIVTQLVSAIGTHEVLLSSQSVPARVVQNLKDDAPLTGPRP